MGRLRWTRAGFATLVLAATLAAAPHAEACAGRGVERAPFPVYVDTLTVELSADRGTYKPGDRLGLTAVVSRGADGRPGVPVPANVEVQLTTPRGHVVRRFARESGDDGRVTFSWRVPTDYTPGDLHAKAKAQRAVGPNFDCFPLLAERGTGNAAPLARVTR